MAGVRTAARQPVVPIHPEPIAGHPELMVWVLPPDTFTEAGPVLRAPGGFGAMLAEGLLAYAIIRPGGGQLLVRLRPGVSWREVGGEVRTALHAALAQPGQWAVGATVPAQGTTPPGGSASGSPSGAGTDELLREAAGAVLAGEFGEYVHSHGGGIEVLDVTDGVVSIRFHGACHGCPAATITMHVRFERELRARCPILVSVRSR